MGEIERFPFCTLRQEVQEWEHMIARSIRDRSQV